MPTGTIIKVHPKGFGFIRSDKSRTELFFHATSLVNLDFDDPALIESRVSFTEEYGPDGRLRAVQVRPEY